MGDSSRRRARRAAIRRLSAALVTVVAAGAASVAVAGPSAAHVRPPVAFQHAPAAAQVTAAGRHLAHAPLTASQAPAGTGNPLASKMSPVTGRLAALTGVKRAVQFSPSPGVEDSLFGVRALSASNAWAMGTYCTASCQTFRTLALHWNGSTWLRVKTPNPSSVFNILEQVAIVAPDNVWAVGWSGGTSRSQALVLHWNGKAWSRVSSPNPGRRQVLIGMTAVSARNIWAAGWTCVSACGGNSQVLRTLILHWNGTTWSRAASPNPGRRVNILIGMSSVSATNLWAVGYECASGCLGVAEGDHPLILHWNGKRWSAAKTPAAKNAILGAVSSPASGGAWAVGYRCRSGCSSFNGTGPTLVLHWNGSSWSIMASPSPGTHANLLEGVTAVSPADAWAVGFYCVRGCATRSETDHTLILHWNGTKWSRAVAPNPAKASNELIDTGARSATDVWAVGSSLKAHSQDTLILRWNGTKWSVK
jgi:hypothetical protein